MRDKALFLFIILVLFSPAFLLWKYSPEMRVRSVTHRKECDLLSEFKNAFAKQIKEGLALDCESIVCERAKICDHWRVDCCANRRATVEEARGLFLNVMHNFIEAVNADKQLQSLLKIQPISREQVDLYIKFRRLGGKRYADGSVSHLSYYYDRFSKTPDTLSYFFAQDPMIMGSSCSIDETFKEADERYAANPVKNLAVHAYSEKEKEIDRFLLTFVRKMEKKHGMVCPSFGAKMVGGIEEVSATFKVRKMPSKLKERALILNMSQQLLKDINSHEKLRPYLVENPFPVERLKLRVSYEQKRGSFPNRGYATVAAVALKDGKLLYFDGISSPSAENWPHNLSPSSMEFYREVLEKGQSNEYRRI